MNPAFPRRLFMLLVDYFALFIFRLTGFLSRALPPSLLQALFRLIGTAVFYCRPAMRRDLLSKISQAMPTIRDQREVARIGRQACVSATKPMLDLLIFGRHREEYMGGLHVEGWDHMERADGEGKGVLLLFIHIGA